MFEEIKMFSEKYKRYLKEYIFTNGDERILLEAFESLLELKNPNMLQAIDILEIHFSSLEDILNVGKDNDTVQWIFIKRANEFLAQIFITIDNILLKLKEQVSMDILTKLYNRLAFESILPKLWFESLKDGLNLSLAMLDIDNFKEINDYYGHVIGDEVLKEVARIIRDSIREKDKAFRYGGEEFVIIFFGVDYSNLFIPLERIRERVENLNINSLNKKTTISIGASSLLEDSPSTVEEFIHFADIAMYEAKKMGKNRIVFYKELNHKPQV